MTISRRNLLLAATAAASSLGATPAISQDADVTETFERAMYDRDYDSYVKLIKIASAGNMDANLLLTQYRLSKRSEVPLAHRALQELIVKGNAAATFHLLQFHKNWTTYGLLVAQENINKAELGDPNAMFFLGVMYHFGRYVDPNDKKALQWLQQSAAKGNKHAMTHIGRIYEGIEKSEDPDVAKMKDVNLALKWYQRAASAGDAHGAYAVGATLKEQGKDSWAYLPSIRQSAKLGYPSALEVLGEIYLKGEGVEASRDQAVSLWKEGARLGSSGCYVRLGTLAQDAGNLDEAWITYRCAYAHWQPNDSGTQFLRVLLKDKSYSPSAVERERVLKTLNDRLEFYPKDPPTADETELYKLLKA